MSLHGDLSSKAEFINTSAYNYNVIKCTDKKRKSNFPHIYGNPEWICYKVLYEEGLLNI